jgi:hypothetical protein
MKLKQAATTALFKNGKHDNDDCEITTSASVTASAAAAAVAATQKKHITVGSSNSTVMLFNFHVDLVQEAQNHMRFLRKLHANGTTTTTLLQCPSRQRQALHRYVNCWLPLVAKFHIGQQIQQQQQQQQQLIPPSDVAWLWHCHRLAPMHYERYVHDRFGKHVILEANPRFSSQDLHDDNNNNNNVETAVTAVVATFTQWAWCEMFPNEPFFLQFPLLLPPCISTMTSRRHRIRQTNRTRTPSFLLETLI